MEANLILRRNGLRGLAGAAGATHDPGEAGRRTGSHRRRPCQRCRFGAHGCRGPCSRAGRVLFDAKPIPDYGLLKALNRLLPAAIRVTSALEAPPAFHARRAALAKTYEYRIQRSSICPPFESRYVYWHPYALDEEQMGRAARLFEGEHDFRSFASAGRNLGGSAVRTVFSSELRRAGDRLVYRVRGTGFLYRMVRNMVGTLLDVGRGNVRRDEVEAILQARDRRAAGPTAPARGLFLASVEYPASSRRIAEPSAS